MKAADLKGTPRRLTISGIALEAVGDDGDKPVMSFSETDQKLVLNKTNASLLAEAFGDEMADWEGQAILLKPETTDFAGKRVPCLRIAIPKATPMPVAGDPF